MKDQDLLITTLLIGLFIHYLSYINKNEVIIISNFNVLKVEQK